MPYGLKDIELQKLSEVFASNERIDRVVLYGSRAKGNNKPFSDVDITMIGENLTNTDLNRISLAIDDLLLPYQFDISIFRTLKNEDLIAHIHRVGITIYERENEWKEYKLGEIAAFSYGSLPKKNLLGSGGYITYSGYKYQDAYPECNCEVGDVILVARGVGGTGDVKLVSQKCYLTNLSIRIMLDNKIIQNQYFYYLFQTENLRYLDSGSAQSQITIKDLSNVIIEVPSVEYQKDIVAVLSSLDDKIDLLRRENTTLEAMAETLFRQWFVEGAKEEWKEGVISDIAEHIKDSINPQKNSDIIFLHYSIPSYDNGKEPITELGKNIQSNKYVVPKNCILFSKLNPHKDKRVWLMLDDVPDNAVCSTEFQVVKPNNTEFLYFMYGWLTHKENYEEIASGVGGTSGSHQRIDPKSIFSFTCPKVDLKTIQNYNKVIAPLFYKQRKNQQQIQTLIQTRDGLLPRLMNSEIII